MAATARKAAPESLAKGGPHHPPRQCHRAVADGATKASIDVDPYVAAIVLAGVAAFFSIKGMVVQFQGASLAVVAMAFAMEGAKLVAGWLAQRWRVTAPVWLPYPSLRSSPALPSLMQLAFMLNSSPPM
jgi:hypothetical protein